jgi:hypothetical protein
VKVRAITEFSYPPQDEVRQILSFWLDTSNVDKAILQEISVEYQGRILSEELLTGKQILALDFWHLFCTNLW